MGIIDNSVTVDWLVGVRDWEFCGSRFEIMILVGIGWIFPAWKWDGRAELGAQGLSD